MKSPATVAARAFARRLGHDAVAQLLQDTLDEETAADAKLSDIGEAMINPVAARK